MRRRPLLLTVLPPGTIPSVLAPRYPRGRRKGARAALSVAAARGGRARPCMQRRTPQGACAHGEWAPASWPWLLPPVLVSCAVLFFSGAPVFDSRHFVPVLPRTRENRWIFVSRLNQFGKQVLQVVLPRARSEKHATLWLLFSTVPSSEFWCFLQSKKSPALSFCPV
jgi:hypothetical protein